MTNDPIEEATVSIPALSVLDLAQVLLHIKSGLESGFLKVNLNDEADNEDAAEEARFMLTETIDDLAKYLASVIFSVDWGKRDDPHAEMHDQSGDLEVIFDDTTQTVDQEKFSEALSNPANTIIMIPPEPIES
jgi:hypothetical protein